MCCLLQVVTQAMMPFFEMKEPGGESQSEDGHDDEKIEESEEEESFELIMDEENEIISKHYMKIRDKNGALLEEQIICIHCDTRLKLRDRAKGKSGRTSNAIRHFEKSHKTVRHFLKLKQDPSLKKKPDFFSPPARTKTSATATDDTVRALSLWICEQTLPFSVVDAKSFHSFIAMLAPKWTVPVSATIRKWVSILYDERCKEIRKLLSDMTYVSIAFDPWTSFVMDDYLAITVHGITNSTIQLHAMEIGCIPLYGVSHTGENLGVAVKKCLRHFGISTTGTDGDGDENDNDDDGTPRCYEFPVTTQLLSLTHDNAANVRSAANMFADSDDFPSTPLPALEVAESINCFVHTLQLVIKHSLEDCPSASKLIKDVRKVSGFIKNSSKSKALLSQMATVAGLDAKAVRLGMDVRWNSDLFMLERQLELQPVFKDDRRLYPVGMIPFNAKEWKLMADVVLLLKPFESMTLLFSSRTQATISHAFPQYVTLMQTLSAAFVAGNSRQYQTEYARTLCESLLKHLRQYSAHVLKPGTVIAAGLDPRYRGFRFISDISEREVYNKMCEDTIEELLEQQKKKKATDDDEEAHDEGRRAKESEDREGMNVMASLWASAADTMGQKASEYAKYLARPVDWETEKAFAKFDVLAWYKGERAFVS